MRYGLIGEHLTHSFSKIIHEQIDDYRYELIEIAPDCLDAFMKEADFSGINVTIPYKQDVIPFLDEISDQAKAIGAVNTIVNRGGKLHGFNTDYFGMRDLLDRVGISLPGKKVLILGSGGTSKTAQALVKDLGASKVFRVSRTGKEDAISYEEALRDHADAQVIVNTTPVGMFPGQDASPVDLDCFPDLCGLVDAIYNPLRTKLVIEAQKRNIPAEGGLYMLVAQAVYASGLFRGKDYDTDLIGNIYRDLLHSRRNIVLTGMPHSGKSTVGKILAKKLGRKPVDTDRMIEEKAGRPIPDLIREEGEAAFRDVESEVIRQLENEKNLVISTGGGAVLREENVDSLKKNGILVFLDRPVSQLKPSDDRPLSDTEDKLKKLYEIRYPIYKRTADLCIVNDQKPWDAVSQIMHSLKLR